MTNVEWEIAKELANKYQITVAIAAVIIGFISAVVCAITAGWFLWKEYGRKGRNDNKKTNTSPKRHR